MRRWLVALNGMCAKCTTWGTILKRLSSLIGQLAKTIKDSKILLLKKRFDYFIANITSYISPIKTHAVFYQRFFFLTLLISC